MLSESIYEQVVTYISIARHTTTVPVAKMKFFSLRVWMGGYLATPQSKRQGRERRHAVTSAMAFRVAS
jgi:hypothetical protein